jgi:CP family cyanate transporter-like MFS transporter
MRDFWVAVGLLWLIGVGLRLTILAVPPVISAIAADLALSGTEIGILSGLPVILFGIAALPGSLLIARWGALATVVAGLTVAAFASALRGAALDVLVLYGATILMSAGVAVVQPALPPLVRQWLPHRVSLGSAIYTNGLLVGETLPVMLAIPLVLPLVEGSWRLSLAVWGIPLLGIALLALVLAPAPSRPSGSSPEARSWWPDWSNRLIWQVGILLGSVNGVYFSSNAFLPGHLTAAGRPDLISSVLTALNFGQLPASFALLAVAGKLERRAWPFVLSGALIVLCLAGIVATASAWTVLFAGALGFLLAAVLTLGFALPALLSAAGDVARVSAAVFTLSYGEALVVAVLSGAAWDLGGSPRFAFLPIALSALPLLFLPQAIGFKRLRAPAGKSG